LVATPQHSDVPGVLQGRAQIMQHVYEEVKTREMERTEATTRKLTMKVIKYSASLPGSTMIEKGGVFSSSVIEYVIETQPVKWTVIRKYDEVMWLRDQLQKHFPAAIVSPALA